MEEKSAFTTWINLGKNVLLKRCKQEDALTLSQVATQSYTEHYTYLWEDGAADYMTSHFNKQVLTQELLQTNSHFFLVFNKEQAIGFFKLNVLGQHTLELERIYLLKKAIGKGIGKKLMLFVDHFAKKHHCNSIELKTMQLGKAWRFYEKMGFGVIGETSLQENLIKKQFSLMYVMRKNLSN